jgi:2-polyprenyl-3-methyl-5-hydroxy-6-metoxy-1,4-benzoquinol methylase
LIGDFLVSLADEEFWNNYWKNTKIPCEINPRFSFDRCLIRLFKHHFKRDSNASIFEVGCAPGRWLLFFNQEFGYHIAGLDNSKMGVQKTLENFRWHGTNGTMFNEDIFKFKSDKKYDYLLSLGFIEHFEDVDYVLEKHLALLKKDGTLILGVPNFLGINYFIQKTMDENILKKHNLGIMKLSFFNYVAKKFKLKIEFVGYIGGFEPALFIPPPNSNLVIRGLIKLARIGRSVEIFDNINSPSFSSLLIAILKKTE